MPTLPSEVLQLLAAAKLSPEQLALVEKVITIVSAPLDQARVKKNIRQKKWREEKLHMRRLRGVSEASTRGVSEASTQSNKINGVARVEDNNLLPFPVNPETPSTGEREVQEREPPQLNGQDVEEAYRLWNAAAKAHGFTPAKILSDPRRRALRLRLDELGGLPAWREVLAKIARTRWMCGDGDRRWRADLDYILKPQNLIRTMERVDDQEETSSRRVAWQQRRGAF